MKISFELTTDISLCTMILALAFILFLMYVVKNKINGRDLFNGFHFFNHSMKLEKVKAGTSFEVEIAFTRINKEIAYKLWVELCTRKIGLEFDEKNDVILDVYNSWYQFFQIARNLLEEIPENEIHNSQGLIQLTLNILNDGLRPHLTRWQSRFRKWYNDYSKNLDFIRDKSPQEIQREYTQYEALKSDLIRTNKRLIDFKKDMEKIVFGEV